MCGIIGYVGPRECQPLLLHGLQRLEYRGYDSAGIALLEADGLHYTRAVGNLANLRDRADAYASMDGRVAEVAHGMVEALVLLDHVTRPADQVGRLLDVAE